MVTEGFYNCLQLDQFLQLFVSTMTETQQRRKAPYHQNLPKKKPKNIEEMSLFLIAVSAGSVMKLYTYI